jgi:toxin YoeB
MRLLFTDQAWDDYLHWQGTDRKIVTSINDLINDIRRDPFRGLGKPEPLKHSLAGWWSRRITLEHRLVYRVSGTQADRLIEIVQCRYHR